MEHGLGLIEFAVAYCIEVGASNYQNANELIFDKYECQRITTVKNVLCRPGNSLIVFTE